MYRQPLIIEKCTNQLWEGVECDLAAGHKGPHHRAACAEGAALAWRSSASARPPIPPSAPAPAMFRLASLPR